MATNTKATAKPKTEIKHLFKDAREYKDDVFVAVNGKSYYIKRGVDVEVPAEVAEVIDNSERQRQESENYIAQQVEDYYSQCKRLGYDH